MKLRRSLLAAAVPLAVAAVVAGPAIAAGSTRAGVRVEGTSRTLVPGRTVVVPTSGSITRGSAPSGVCRSDSAAGALQIATRGRWNGTYSSGLGIEVTKILGTTALYADGSYWEFFVNDRAATEGVCDTKLKAGDQFLFAQVPAKGRAELPLVVSAPKRVSAGTSFAVRTFVYPGAGSRTTAVRSQITAHPLRHVAEIVHAGRPRTSGRGVDRLSFTKPGTYTLSASAPGEIRSAVSVIKVIK